jgi:hypothetical protein
MDCGIEKPPTEFYTHPAMADGLLGRCRPCYRIAVRTNRQKKVDYYRAYDRERYATDAERHARVDEYGRQRRLRWPRVLILQREKARRWVNAAIAKGRMIRGACEVCGAPKADGHHEDYSKPLVVRWLCRVHHAKIHGLARRMN